jgi:hypothetical protein
MLQYFGPSNVPNGMDFRLEHLISFEVDFELLEQPNIQGLH